MLLQAHRKVCLSQLATLFPQPIQYESRLRNLQRFLYLPKLNVKLLWFPIIKQIVKQQFRPQGKNRAQRRHHKKLTHKGYLLLAVDRTQWRERNLFVLSLVWGNHALPIYWGCLGKKGNSNFKEQKALLIPVLKLLKPYPVVVIGDREFHSVKLGEWLHHRDVKFALRQKRSRCGRVPRPCNRPKQRSTHIQETGLDYQSLKHLGIKPGTTRFITGISCTQKHKIGSLNLGVTWKRQYRGKGAREPWYILTNLDDLNLTLSFYKARWGIESMFKDCKTGGYNLERTWVNETRFVALVLLIAIAYTLATFHGESIQPLGVRNYVCRTTEPHRYVERHSHFWIGLHGQLWVDSMADFADLMIRLVTLKPHKRLNFQRGFHALSTLQSVF
jgi:Transposase DDE domain